jgi:hypothetical protein
VRLSMNRQAPEFKLSLDETNSLILLELNGDVFHINCNSDKVVMLFWLRYFFARERPSASDFERRQLVQSFEDFYQANKEIIKELSRKIRATRRKELLGLKDELDKALAQLPAEAEVIIL